MLCGCLQRSLDRVSPPRKTENVTIGFGLGGLVVVFVQAQFVFFEPLKNATEALIMPFLPSSENNDVN